MAIAIKLTELQREELLHKLNIIEHEDDLLESYEITSTQAADIARRVGEQVTVLTKDEADILVGETENLIEIAQGNMEWAQPAERTQMAAYIGSLRKLIKKLEGEQHA